MELGDEEGFGPEGFVGGGFGEAGRVPVAELVVEDDGDAVGGVEVEEGEHVFVAGAGAAVEDD